MAQKEKIVVFRFAFMMFGIFSYVVATGVFYGTVCVLEIII